MNLYNQMSLDFAERLSLSEKYNISNSSKTKYNPFLSSVMKKLRKNRVSLSEDNFFSYSILGNMGFLWLQTPACKNSKAGCCTVCNYWNGKYIYGIIDKVTQENIDFSEVTALLVNTCGSCLDSYELCKADQEKLLRWLNSIPPKEIILETHMNTLTPNTIHMVKEMLPNKKIFFEVGIESISDDILFYSLNKPTNVKRFREVLQLIHNNNAFCIANVLLGAPFLNNKEQIMDAVTTIKYLLDANIDNVVLFPVNIKPNTIPEVLYRHDMFEPIKADMLIKVLEQLPENELTKIDISWYGEHIEKNVIGPYYCHKCQSTLQTTIRLFNNSISLNERRDILKQMKGMICNCDSQKNEYFQMTYYERLEKGYDTILSFFQKEEASYD